MSSAATLARPYARAAFQVARGQQALPAWSAALSFSAQAAANPAVAALFGHPHVGAKALVELLQAPGASEEQARFLAVLAEHKTAVLSRAQLLELVWGYDFAADTNVVDVFIGYLRRKLEANGAPRLLHTVRGVGFVLRQQ